MKITITFIGSQFLVLYQSINISIEVFKIYLFMYFGPIKVPAAIDTARYFETEKKTLKEKVNYF